MLTDKEKHEIRKIQKQCLTAVFIKLKRKSDILHRQGHPPQFLCGFDYAMDHLEKLDFHEIDEIVNGFSTDYPIR